MLRTRAAACAAPRGATRILGRGFGGLPGRTAPPVTPLDLTALLPDARLHLPAGASAVVALADATHDSRGAGPGVLFACRPGMRADGHDFAAAAVAAGSPALLVERELDVAAPQVVVPSVAAALGRVAAAVHEHPSERLRLIGVTGTSGKTTTTFLVQAALEACGHSTGLIGTVETRVAGAAEQGPRTTPEATDLQRLLARMVAAGVTAAAMEVSSHGLALGRIAGTRFAAVGFTNLSQDHLDFHTDLEDYFAAKASLFTRELAPVGAVDVGSSWGRRLAANAPISVLRIAVDGGPDLRAEDVRAGAAGSTFIAVLDGARLPVALALPGRFNVANALLALALATLAGCDAATAVRGIEGVQGVPGRMERVDAGQPFTVLVDYAHKPDALAAVLRTARDLATGSRVLVVIGCGGDRDREKRPQMGRIAAEGSDHAFLTSDNPRSEDPGAIVSAMAEGARAAVAAGDVAVEVDRRTAIAQAVHAARPGDVLVIAGKGHETYQELADRTIPFDDRAVAREALAAAGWAGP